MAILFKPIPYGSKADAAAFLDMQFKWAIVWLALMVIALVEVLAVAVYFIWRFM